ncbi:hypothetical protein Pint_07038 [Pistacia integerrima]|uniref:Uncharacterized protein n=1 Tax=Pistacia integerrima TaxID=434235 RepID=A0ACC0XV65_9ROSI|nr:hypothetical protein Pint_07038 [Pistacia integerrima]
MESSFHYSHPVGVSDSNAGAELLDIILMKFSCRRRPGHVQSRDFSSFFVEWVEAAHRDNSQDNYLYCPTATQLGNNEIEHFQMHWMREGIDVAASHPLITSGVAIGLGSVWALADILNVHCPKHSSKRIGLLNSKKFFHLKGKENLIRMLLWHGSWLTNFVGILSQGLRIAHPEAPATGYMFGKGIYFADLVSKSAQYCYTDKKNPVGLMLFSEVALGEVYTVKKAEVSSPSILHVYPNS